MARQVLMIARAYFPNNAAGAFRPAQLAEHLPKYGWTPTVICAEWTPENAGVCYDAELAARPDTCETVRVPYCGRGSSRIGRGFAGIIQRLFPYRAPLRFYRGVLAAARRLASKKRYDVVWSTYSPGLTHLVASKISREYGMPWVADFRDLPDQVEGAGEDRWVRRAIRREVRICDTAKTLVTTSPGLVELLHKRHRIPAHLICNGFDPGDYPPIEDGPFEKFSIVYTGVLYQHSGPDTLLTALDLLYGRGDMDMSDFSVEFYGSTQMPMEQYLKGRKCRDIVVSGGRISHREVARLQRRAVVLLLLLSSLSRRAIPMKLFGYLAAQRPILSLADEGGAVDGILRQTQAGVNVSAPEKIADTLEAWYRQWKQTGTVAVKSIPEQVARYSREHQAGQLAELFDSVIDP